VKRIARRYAKALYELAVEQRIIDEIERDFNEISDLLSANEEFQEFLSNPLIHEKKKYDVLKEIFSDRLHELTFNFLLMVNEKKRIELLTDIIDEFRRLMLEHRNEVEGELISAIDLETEQVSKIIDNIETMIGKSVSLKQQIDRSIIGGFVVRVQDLVIDNSIRYQLNKLREQLVAE